MSKMTLSDFIRQKGDGAVAGACGVKPRTAADWRRGDRVPLAKYHRALLDLGLSIEGICAANGPPRQKRRYVRRYPALESPPV